MMEYERESNESCPVFSLVLMSVCLWWKIVPVSLGMCVPVSLSMCVHVCGHVWLLWIDVLTLGDWGWCVIIQMGWNPQLGVQ